MSIGRINRPGPPSGEQAHLEGLRAELEPGEYIVGDYVCRTQWIPAGGDRGRYGFAWALMVPVRRIRPLPGPREQIEWGLRYMRERYGDTYAITREPWRWYQRPRWLWKLLHR